MKDTLASSSCVTINAPLCTGCTVPVMVSRTLLSCGRSNKPDTEYAMRMMKIRVADLKAVTPYNPYTMFADAYVRTRWVLYDRNQSGERLARFRLLLDMAAGTRNSDIADDIRMSMDNDSGRPRRHMRSTTVTLADIAILAHHMQDGRWRDAGVRLPYQVIGAEERYLQAWETWATLLDPAVGADSAFGIFDTLEFMSIYADGTAPLPGQSDAPASAVPAVAEQEVLKDYSVNDDVCGARSRHAIVADAKLRYELEFNAKGSSVRAVGGMLDFSRYSPAPSSVTYGKDNHMYVVMDCMAAIEGWPASQCLYENRIKECSEAVDQIYEDMCSILETVNGVRQRSREKESEE